ncbi:chemotaxis protein CheB [Sphaerisporangium viridialbum]|uniref:chemotaxis protein CheB n=1 Tax=Sphaerisporangium viridialbum TaxID=46189 RepID=UPI003C732C07
MSNLRPETILPAGGEPLVGEAADSGRGDSHDGHPEGFAVVALIASAGGLEALSRVLAPLSPDLPAAVLVALHQDPTRASNLAAILARRTALEVRVAADGAAMEAGLVLVVPPGHHLLVASPARVALIDTGGLPAPRPAADLLLATLAVTCGPRALAVILTGTGSDGQSGVRNVTHRGGTAFAQDEPSSAFFAMPAAAIATGQVHRVLALDDIAAAIIAHTMP